MADSHMHSFCQELRRLRSVVRSYDTLEKARLQGQKTNQWRQGVWMGTGID